jgi:hypothetical protein
VRFVFVCDGWCGKFCLLPGGVFCGWCLGVSFGVLVGGVLVVECFSFACVVLNYSFLESLFCIYLYVSYTCYCIRRRKWRK